MQTLNKVDSEQASESVKQMLTAVKSQMGLVPNIIATLANSETGLAAYLAFSGAVAKGNLSAALREQIALAVAGQNGCDYCASAHTFIAAKQGIDNQELSLNLAADSSDVKTKTVLSFVKAIVQQQGRVSEQSLQNIRQQGFSDSDLVEILANTALNIFTNYFNNFANTEVDFPLVKAS